MMRPLLLAFLCSSLSVDAKWTDFDPEKARPASNLKGLRFVSRFMVPYGPDIYSDNAPQSTDDRPYRGYGFGMGAAEEFVYDHEQKYAYVGSDGGWVTIVDYEDPSNPQLTNFNVDVSEEGELNDIVVCPAQKWLFVAVREQGVIEMYQSVQRSAPSDPKHLNSITVGNFPSQILPNSNCTLLAISNENFDDLTHGLVTIVRDLDKVARGGEPNKVNIAMDAVVDGSSGWDDDYTLRKGLHMPLTKNALEYWDLHSPIAEEADFTEVRSKYRSSFFVQGESMVWASPRESELLVNLQLNNGLMRIDVARNQALALAGYGLKDHSVVPIDINAFDNQCELRTYPNLFSMRNPDSVFTLRYNDKIYLLTANEGDVKEYGAFEDEIKARDLFQNGSFGLPHVTTPQKVFDPADPLGGNAAPFHANCIGDSCVGDVKVALGSTSIDYELDPENPTFHRMVLHGGRGWTIYELPDDPDALLKLVFDSGDEVERMSCANFPWAYNSIQDEEMAPAANMPNNTLWRKATLNGDEDLLEELAAKNDPNADGCSDQGDGTPGACSLKDKFDQLSIKGGPQVENIVSGVACGRLITLIATEKESVAMLYDMTNIAAPDLVQVFHLSLASRSKGPGVAYNDGTIGEIDPESFIFIPSEESPSGKAAVMFAGAFSGTISYWEFDCVVDEDLPTSDLRTSNTALLTFGMPLLLAGTVFTLVL